MKALPFTLFITSLFLSPWAFSHGGRLDKQGGHVDNKTGYYHCHTNACYERYGEDVGTVTLDDAAPFVTLYDRTEWPHWSDLDGDCQNTRDEVLKRCAVDGDKICYNDKLKGRLKETLKRGIAEIVGKRLKIGEEFSEEE